MRKCCGKDPKVLHFHNNSADGRSMDFYWCECPNCKKRTSYGYDTPKEAEKAWNDGIVGRAMPV